MKEPAPQRPPGDKAAWYIRMLGIDPSGSQMTLQEVAKIRETSRTSEAFSEMSQATSELATPEKAQDPRSDGPPTELSKTASRRRRVRWPLVLIALFVGAALVVALWWLPQASAQRASTQADRIRDALSALQADLAGLQGALATATDPASEVPDLGVVGADLSAISTTTARLLDLANEPIPRPLPLSPQEPFDALAPITTDLEPLAAEASAIRVKVGEIADYRLALSKVIAIEELPLTADSAIVTVQRAALAEALAASVAALDAMATSGPLSGHRAFVEREISAFAQWQDDYLKALGDNDPQAAGELVEQLQLRRDGLAFDLVEPLASLRTTLDRRIIDLSEQLGRSIALVPRG